MKSDKRFGCGQFQVIPKAGPNGSLQFQQNLIGCLLDELVALAGAHATGRNLAPRIRLCTQFTGMLTCVASERFRLCFRIHNAILKRQGQYQAVSREASNLAADTRIERIRVGCTKRLARKFFRPCESVFAGGFSHRQPIRQIRQRRGEVRRRAFVVGWLKQKLSTLLECFLGKFHGKFHGTRFVAPIHLQPRHHAERFNSQIAVLPN